MRPFMICYWSRVTEDYQRSEIYLVPTHAANPPLLKDDWVPITYYSRYATTMEEAYQEFLEGCAIYGMQFLKPHDIEKITGKPFKKEINR